MKTLVLAHYYTNKEVQQLTIKSGGFIGDSLELSLRARESKAERIVFASVKFMAETAKILNPQAEVIIPNIEATCSLVTMTNVGNITVDYADRKRRQVVTYINSSVELKAKSDVIVTSSNVEAIVSSIINKGQSVLFTPDRNMGAYLRWSNPQWGNKFKYYEEAICEVHDRFVLEDLGMLYGWTDGPKYLLAHPESPLPVLKKANMVGSTSKMLKYITDFPTNKPATFFVATEEGLLYNMREARPDLDIRLAPIYSGCQCNACPYMKKNTVESVNAAINGGGSVIDYIPEDIRIRALQPIERMLKW